MESFDLLDIFNVTKVCLSLPDIYTFTQAETQQ